MDNHKHLPILRVIGLAALAIALAACGQTTPSPDGTALPPTASPEPTTQSEVILDVELEVGPGPYAMIDAAQGLDKLTSYRATLTKSFTGTRDGAAEQWTTTYSMLVTHQPEARQLTVTRTSEPESTEANPLPITELDGVQLTGSDETQCSAAPVGGDIEALADTEPARFVPGVFGADEAGTATVNGVATNHYTFDQRALTFLDGKPYTGELWAAADSDTLVKLILTGEATPEIYGDGVEGTVTWEYNLTEINAAVTISAPKTCPPAPLDIAEMPGATDVVKGYASMSFSLAGTSIDDVLAFYTDKLTADGLVAAGDPIVEPDQMGSAVFTRDDQSIAVIVSIEDGVTHVSLSLRSAEVEKAK